MRTFTFIALYFYFFSTPYAIPLAGAPEKTQPKMTRVPEWVCLYNVGPNAKLSKPGVRKACDKYRAKVQSNLTLNHGRKSHK